MRTVYLAGPEVFFADPIAAGAAKKALAAAFGFEGLYPLDNDLAAAPGETPTALSRRIYAANRALMEAADFGVFNLTPFRGPSADVGTAYELGHMKALGKPVFGYTNVVVDYSARVPGGERDALGHAIEAFGNADNLMLDAALDWDGGQIVRVQVAPDRLWSNLDGFHRCLEMAAAWFSPA